MDFVKESFILLYRRKERVLAVISAISAAIFLLIITGSVSIYFMNLSSGIKKSFENRIFLCEKKSFWIGGGLISEEKLDVINSVHGIKKIIPMLVARLDDNMVIMGVPFVLVGVPSENIYDYLGESSIIKSNKPVNGPGIILGWDIAKSKNLKPGSKITIRNGEFTVAGVCKKTSSVTDRQAVADLKTVQKLLTREHLLTSIIVIPSDKEYTGAITKTIRKQIPWMQTITSNELENGMKESTVFWNSLTVIFMLISGIGSLLSISTVTAMGVTERKKEIAVKKAIGAEDKQIFAEFFAESLVMTSIGWTIGLCLALVFIKVSQIIPMTRETTVFELNTSLIIVSLIWSILIALAGCYFPLKKITSMNVAETLRR